MKSDEEDSNVDAIERLVTTIKRLSMKDSSNEQQIVSRSISSLTVVEFREATLLSLNRRHVVSGLIDRTSRPPFVIEVSNSDDEDDEVLLQDT